MNILRRRRKKQRVLEHRQERYLHAINKVIDGEAEPEYATTRFKKLKEIIGR